MLTGHKLIVVVCDNGGFAVINRLQNFKGSASFNNLLEDCRRERDVRVDFAKHAESMGAIAEHVASIGDLEAAFARGRPQIGPTSSSSTCIRTSGRRAMPGGTSACPR